MVLRKWREWHFQTLLGDCQPSTGGAATLRNSLIVSQKAEHRITVWPRNFPLATYPREIKTRPHKKHGYKCSSSIIHSSQRWKPKYPSADAWTKKQCCHGPSRTEAGEERGRGVMEDPLGLVTRLHQWAGVHRERQKAVHLGQRILPAQALWSPRECTTKGSQRGKGGVRSCLGEEAGVALGPLTS